MFENAPRTRAALDAALAYLDDGHWRRTADVERVLVEVTGLAPRTVRNLLEIASTRSGSPRKPLQRRGTARSGSDDRAVRLRRS